MGRSCLDMAHEHESKKEVQTNGMLSLRTAGCRGT